MPPEPVPHQICHHVPPWSKVHLPPPNLLRGLNGCGLLRRPHLYPGLNNSNPYNILFCFVLPFFCFVFPYIIYSIVVHTVTSSHIPLSHTHSHTHTHTCTHTHKCTHTHTFTHTHKHTESDCCVRQCCGPSRPFSMSILDNTQREVSRPLLHVHVVTALGVLCCFALLFV